MSTKLLEKQDIEYINKISKYVDKTIIVNLDKQQEDMYDLDVYDKNSKIGTTKLNYDFRCRSFTKE